MNRSVYYRTGLVTFSILTLITLLGCFCWPSLPNLIHQGGCAPIQAAQPAGGKAGVIPPPRPKIVYIRSNDIWIMNADGKENKQLTETSEAEFGLSFARYSEKIWFIRASGVQDSLPYGDVFCSDLAGKNTKQITDGLKVRFAAVSLDGKKLAVSVIKEVPDIAMGGQPGETADMWIIGAETEKQTGAGGYTDLSSDLPYTPGLGREGSTFLAWSPANDRVAFTYKADGSASLGISTKVVYTAGADGTNRKELIKSADEPSFNNQGTKIAAITGGHWDTMGVVDVSADGGTPETVLPVAPGAAGSTLLYSANTPFWMNTYEDITIVDNVFYGKTTYPAEPGEPVNTLERYNTVKKTTTVLATQNGANARISHASSEYYSNKIVFQVGRTDLPAGPDSTIWTVKPDGTELVRLSKGTGDSEPTWAEDNSWWKSNGGTAKANKCHWPYEDRTIQF